MSRIGLAAAAVALAACAIAYFWAHEWWRVAAVATGVAIIAGFAGFVRDSHRGSRSPWSWAALCVAVAFTLAVAAIAVVIVRYPMSGES